jgi:hypothetical protein
VQVIGFFTTFGHQTRRQIVLPGHWYFSLWQVGAVGQQPVTGAVQDGASQLGGALQSGFGAQQVVGGQQSITSRSTMQPGIYSVTVFHSPQQTSTHLVSQTGLHTV